MRILLDEDVPVQAVEPLRRVLKGHSVTTVHELGWLNKKDIPVLRDAARAGYDVFVTNDANQLDDIFETEAIKRSGIHHVRYRQKPGLGLHGLGLALGAIFAAMPPLIAELANESSQRLVRITAIDPRSRYEITDPKKTPPKYWPR
ncbi:DUF5615 family PIN-like protein [Kribbella sp. NPDC002412]